MAGPAHQFVVKTKVSCREWESRGCLYTLEKESAIVVIPFEMVLVPHLSKAIGLGVACSPFISSKESHTSAIF